MNVRKAILADVPAIAEIYERIHDEEEKGLAAIGWIRGVYPTADTARAAIERGDLFVMEDEDKILAAAVINQIQVPEYVDAKWQYEAKDEEVMVLHALVVDPQVKRKGCGKAFVAFYEEYAKENGCPYLRIDTNERNQRARSLYASLGYKEVGIVGCVFNGIPDVHLVCLEKSI